MANTFTIIAREGSTFGIKVDFVEETSDGEPGSPITPNPGLTWSLRKPDTTIVNGRENVPLTPAPSVTIVLSGDDLKLPGGYPVTRFLTINGTYDSTLGSNLPLRDEVSFQIENLVGVL
jgi:hypothetical protein